MLKLLSRIFLATFICLAVSNVSSGQMTSNQNGKVDRTFGTYGFAHMMPSRRGNAIVLGNGIAFAVTTTILPFPAIGLSISKQLADGSFDTGFGQNGLSNTTFPRYVDPQSIVVQPDGKILIGGYINPSAPTNGWDYFLARFLPNGQLDTLFGSGGFVALDIAPDTNDPADFSYDTVGSIIVNDDGTILVSGTSDQRLASQSKTCVKAVLAKFRSDGTLETSFGSQGISSLTLIINEGFTFGSSPLRLKSIGNGKYIGGIGLIRGQFGDPNRQPAILIRYLENGAIDKSFGVGGIVDLTVGSPVNLNVILYDFTVLMDGKLLVLTAGALNRLKPDGSVDETFGDNGRLRISHDATTGFTVVSDGSIITSGLLFRSTSSGNRTSSELRKYFSDGSPDVRFGISGRLSVDTPEYDTYLGSIFQLLDSTINVIGYRTIYNGQIFRSKISIKRKL